MNHLRRLTFATARRSLSTCTLGAPARAADPLTAINLINLPADSSAVVYYALDLGYFKDENLDVKITPMTNSGAIIAAIAGGGGDIGNSVVGSLADARAKGIPVLYFAPAGLYDAVSPTAALVTARKIRLDQESFRLWRGKSSPSAASTISRITPRARGSIRTAANRPTSSSSNCRSRRWPRRSKRIDADAAYIIDPFLTAGGDLHSLGRAAEAVAPRYQATGWIANESWLASHADVALRFGVAIRKAAVWANAHQKESAVDSAQIHEDRSGGRRSTCIASSTRSTSNRVCCSRRSIRPRTTPATRPVSANTLIWAPAK